MDGQTRPVFLAGGGRLGARIREHDWSATPLGPPAGWPVTLRTLVVVMLGSRQPMFVTWGPERTLLYNDGYARILGGKHPVALGGAFLQVWAEVRDDLGPLVEQVDAGDAVQMDDITLIIDRNGTPEETHFAFSYTPVRDEHGQVVGMFCPCMETTAQVLAERGKVAELKRFEQLFAQAPGFMAMLRGPEHVFDLVNPAYMQLIGHRDLIGRPICEALPELRDQGCLERMDRVYATGQAYTASAMRIGLQRRPGGAIEHRFIDVVYQPVTDADGTITGIFAEGSDVTERVVAEHGLRASEAQFRALAQAMPNHAWTATPDGSLDWFNEPVYAYSGLGHDDLAGQGWTRIIHPDDLAQAAETWAASLATGRAYETEFRIRGADGTYRWHLVRAQPTRAADGATAQWIGTNTDIQEQKAAADALAGLNAELERRVAETAAERDRVWKNSRDLLVVVGADGVFRAVNPAWTAILGHAPADVVGRSFLDFVWPDDAAATQGGLEQAVSDGNLTSFENRYRHRDGTPRWISWHTSLEGDLVFAYGRHVTAEKDQAQALQAAEAQLRQAQKMDAVGQLTGGLAHDFNNLLAGISGSLELLQTRLTQGRTGDLDRYITAAQGASKRAAALTHRLLAFSRRQTLDPRPTDIDRLVAGMAELIDRTVGPAIRVEVVGTAGLWTTLVDPPQLENALLNLCINARDAMPDGGRLTIETANRWVDERAGRERCLPPGQYLSLCVTDTGTGMPPEVIARAFDPFFTTKPIGQGTGLGLSMIYGFARQSGGQVRIYSEVGQGTTLCLYLPRHHGSAEAADIPAVTTELPSARQGQTVLVIDDEPAVRMLVTEILEDLGYVAIEAADGPAGLRVLQSAARIDLLVTDVGLPGGMNGRQVADAGRTLRPGLKVLFITGYAESSVVGNGGLEAGMQVLTKPFSMDVLASRITDLIAGA